MGKKPVRKASARASASGGKRGRSKPAPKASAGRERLEEALVEAIRQVDEAGLAFLLNQAHVLIHNTQVEKINRELAELDRKNRDARQTLGAAAAPPVRIEESDNGKTFFLGLGGTRKVLAMEEIKRLVRICYAAENKSAALRQLYTVLARDRGDILVDAKIGGAGNPLIEGLFHALREKYRLEDR
jgi:hypothetical protein